MRVYPKNAKELIKMVLETSPHRQANYCVECDELVEEPMMICRDDANRRGPEKIFVDDRNTKKLARMLRVTLIAIERMKASNPSLDLSYHTYVERFKFIEKQAEKCFKKIEHIVEES
jgi:hypothetical protein